MLEGAEGAEESEESEDSENSELLFLINIFLIGMFVFLFLYPA